MTRLVINSVPIARGGGLTNLLGLLEGWKNIHADLDITVLVSRKPTIEALQQAGYGHLLHVVPEMPMWKRVIWERFGLPRLLRQLGADVLLTNTFLAPNVPCPQVVHHQNLFSCFANGLAAYARLGWRFVGLTLGARKALRHADANVFISDHLRERSEVLVPASRERNHTVYYGLSDLYAGIQRERRDTQRIPFRLCAVQSVDHHKDTGSLIRALAALVRIAPQHPWQLDIASWGEMLAFKQLAAELGVAERINWLGFLNAEQIAEMLRRSSVMVYPSVFEGFGIPLIEAFACRCPVVAVNTTAIPEVAQDAALLVPPRSPEEIARAVLALCTDAGLRQRLVERGLARSRQFAWTRTARQFCRVFASVLHKPVAADLPEREVEVALPAAA